MLAADGVTIVVQTGGRTEDGTFYDGAITIKPGDDRYEELLPIARQHPVDPPTEPTHAPDPETMAMLREAMSEESEPDPK